MTGTPPAKRYGVEALWRRAWEGDGGREEGAAVRRGLDAKPAGESHETVRAKPGASRGIVTPLERERAVLG